MGLTWRGLTQLRDHPSQPRPCPPAPSPSGFRPADDNQDTDSLRKNQMPVTKGYQASSQKVDSNIGLRMYQGTKGESDGKERGDPRLAGISQWPSPAPAQPNPWLHSFSSPLAGQQILRSFLSSRSLFSAPAQTLKRGCPAPGSLSISGPNPRLWEGRS